MTPTIRNAWQTPGRPCPVCRGTRLWRSIFGVWTCGTCYPPAAPDLVAAWDEPALDAPHEAGVDSGRQEDAP